MYSYGYKTELPIDNEKLANFGRQVAEEIKSINGREYDVETAAGLYPAGNYWNLLSEFSNQLLNYF